MRVLNRKRARGRLQVSWEHRVSHRYQRQTNPIESPVLDAIYHRIQLSAAKPHLHILIHFSACNTSDQSRQQSCYPGSLFLNVILTEFLQLCFTEVTNSFTSEP